jgi:hypothetical protein
MRPDADHPRRPARQNALRPRGVLLHLHPRALPRRQMPRHDRIQAQRRHKRHRRQQPSPPTPRDAHQPRHRQPPVDPLERRRRHPPHQPTVPPVKDERRPRGGGTGAQKARDSRRATAAYRTPSSAAARRPAKHNPHRHVAKCAPRPPCRGPIRATSERTRSTSERTGFDFARGFGSDGSAPPNAPSNARSRNAVRDTEPRATSTRPINSGSSLNCIGFFIHPLYIRNEAYVCAKRPQRANERDSYLKRARPRKGGARGAPPQARSEPESARIRILSRVDMRDSTPANPHSNGQPRLSQPHTMRLDSPPNSTLAMPEGNPFRPSSAFCAVFVCARAARSLRSARASAFRWGLGRLDGARRRGRGRVAR